MSKKKRASKKDARLCRRHGLPTTGACDAEPEVGVYRADAMRHSERHDPPPRVRVSGQWLDLDDLPPKGENY